MDKQLNTTKSMQKDDASSMRATLICADTLRSAKIAVDLKLQQLCPSDLDVQNYVIVPDRSTLDAEKALLKVLGGSFNTQVVTFKNLANRLVKTQLNYLNKQNGVLLLSRIIHECAGELLCFAKSYATDGFAEKVYEVISAFKYARISPDSLDGERLPPALKNKLHDVKLLYKKYVEYTCEKFVDSADTLELLLNALQKEVIGNWSFYLYDFLSFTSQEKAIIKKLLQNGKQVTVATLYNQEKSKSGIFDNSVALAFKDVCGEVGVDIAIEYFNAPASPLSKRVYDTFFRRTTEKNSVAEDSFTLAVALGIDGEARMLAEYIDDYVKKGGLYSDIKVTCSDVSQYAYSLFKHFADYDIPVYLDEKTALSDTLPAKYLLGYLDCHAFGMQLEKVLAFAKNPLTQLETSGFETFCKKYNVNYRLESFDIGVTDALYEEADLTRKALFDLLNTEQVPKTATSFQYVNILREVSQKHCLEEKTTQYVEKLKSFGAENQARALEQSLKKIEGVLQQVEGILGDTAITTERFVTALTASLSSQTVSVLPSRTDSVFVSNLDKGKDHDVKVLAVLGANEGELPKLYTSCALLSDKNLKDLEQFGLSPEISLAQKNKQERCSLYNLLVEPQEKLYVSYKLRNGREEYRPSSIVNALKNAFNVKEKEEENFSASKKTLQRLAVNAYAQNKEGARLEEKQRASLRYFGEQAKDYDIFKVKIPNVKDGKGLFFGGDTFSVTSIEKFYQCPFACFLSNGIKLTELKEASLDSSDFGNCLHAVFEKFVNVLIHGKQADEKTAERIFDEVMQDERYQAIMRSDKGKAFSKKLKKEAIAHCLTIKEEVENSEFKPFATEFRIGKENDNSPSVNVGEKKIYLKGFADRIDVCGQFAFIIDYKTGNPSFSPTELYDGTKLQLFVYSWAVKKVLDKTPIGSVYYKVIPLSSPEKKSGKIRGRIVADENLLAKIDRKVTSLEQEGLLGNVMTKNGKINGRLSTYIPQGVFDDCQEYAKAIIEKACNFMADGFIEVTPNNGACTYCKAGGICGFNDTRVKSFRKISAIKAEDISAIVSEIAKNSENTSTEDNNG